MILAPSLIANFFRYQVFCRTQKGSSTKVLGTVRQNVLTVKFDNPSLPPSLSPSLALIHNYARYQNFCGTQKCSSTMFTLLWHNSVSMENHDITFPSRKFLIPEFSETLMGSPKKFFATERQQIFYRKS